MSDPFSCILLVFSVFIFDLNTDFSVSQFSNFVSASYSYPGFFEYHSSFEYNLLSTSSNMRFANNNFGSFSLKISISTFAGTETP
ncbi:MAG: hypothetical protein BWX59_02095 [Bacteroidetes bacterium ADurb.Bin028]|nr:MAG: hypothetical protein BWX59_02095 [Bacteroidetes bacterium ADurb.Bin028]